MGLYPLGEWICGDKEATVSILVLKKWTCYIDALPDEWCATFVHPV